jgi:type II secretory pathway component GspD/PulD (secretin)
MIRTMKSYCRTCVLVFLISSLVAPPLSFGSGQAAAQEEQETAKTARECLHARITYTCTDKPIEDVLMDLAEQTGMDIVKSPKVSGNVTARIPDVPLGEALTNILAAHDYTYIATEHMIRVVPISEVTLAKEELVSKIYRITYADANEVATALAGFVSDKGKVGLNRGTSHIVVTDTEYKIKAVDKFVEELDREIPQVEIEVRIYDITTKEGFELDKNWHLARNAPLRTIERTKANIDSDSPSTLTTTTDTLETRNENAGGNETITGHYPASNTAIYSGTQGVITYPNSTSSRTDTGHTETVTEIPKTTYTDTKTETYTTRRRKPFVGGSFDRLAGGTLNFSLLNSAVDLEFALSVLQTQLEAKLLANPRVLVVDNETANFEIIREVPYTELGRDPGGRPITSTVFKKVGILLQVTPHLTRDGMLRVHLTPEFGLLVGQDISGVPTVDTRRADTTALVRDGQTIAIGGLRKTQTSKDISKVPVLADIPLVGGLFQSETESEEINELIVFITPKIRTGSEVAEAQESTGAVAEPNRADGIGRLQQDYEQVISKYPSSLDANRVDPEIGLALAFAYLKAGRFERAKELLTSVTETQTDSSTPYQYLGYCHLKLHELDDAIGSYTKAIELNDLDWEAHRGLGVACMLKAQRSKDDAMKKKALQQWQRSLEIKPDQPNRDGLARLIDLYSE